MVKAVLQVGSKEARRRGKRNGSHDMVSRVGNVF